VVRDAIPAFGFEGKLGCHISFDIKPCLTRKGCNSFTILMTFNMPPVDGKREYAKPNRAHEVVMRLIW